MTPSVSGEEIGYAGAQLHSFLILSVFLLFFYSVVEVCFAVGTGRVVSGFLGGGYLGWLTQVPCERPPVIT